MAQSKYTYGSPCDVTIAANCLRNEDCIQNSPKSRAGTCRCIVGFVRNHDGVCVPAMQAVHALAEGGLSDQIIPRIGNNVTVKKNVTVTAASKTVKLPESEVTLVASANPLPGEGHKYQYDWVSLQQPAGSVAVKHQNGEQLHLTKLSEGLYTFKVSRFTQYFQFFV